MLLLIISFIGGLLTVLAPCTLPVLPIILGSSVSKKNYVKPIVITLSLALSIIIFTLLLRASTIFIDIPQEFWQIVSGTIIILFGVNVLFPQFWKYFAAKMNLSNTSGGILQKASDSELSKKSGFVGDVLIGMSLGPVFASCSPTYALVLASVLPKSFFVGLLNLVVYSIGLIIPMFIIALTGQTLIHSFRNKVKIDNKFKIFVNILNIFMEILFIFIGFGIIFGLDKDFERYLVERDILNFTEIEIRLLENIEK